MIIRLRVTRVAVLGAAQPAMAAVAVLMAIQVPMTKIAVAVAEAMAVLAAWGDGPGIRK